MNTYEVIVSRLGVPHETWEVQTESPARACELCRAERLALGEHDAADTYDAVSEPPSYVEQLYYDGALMLAFRDAVRHMSALADIGSTRLLGYSLDEVGA